MSEFKLVTMVTIVTGLFFSGSSAAVTSSAGGGTVTFSGAVTRSTCNWEGSSPDFTVKLSPITRQELGAVVGLVDAKKEAFDIVAYGGCEYDGYSVAGGMFLVGSSVSADQQYLKNDSGTARGVGIALSSKGTILPFNQFLGGDRFDFDYDDSIPDYDLVGAKNIIHFNAHYYNYGGGDISTGSVVTNVVYYMEYR